VTTLSASARWPDDSNLAFSYGPRVITGLSFDHHYGRSRPCCSKWYEPANPHSGHRDHASSRNGDMAPVIAVDPGSAVDPVHPAPPDPPPGPDPPL